MTDWTGHRQESFRFELLDLDDNLVRQLDGVGAGGQLDFSIHATIRGSGSITLALDDHTDIDWMRSRVRVHYILGDESWPLITAIPMAPVETHSATGASVNVELYDKTLILADDAFGATFSAPPGANPLEWAQWVTLTSGVTAREVLYRWPTPPQLTAISTVWEPGVSKLRMVNDLMDTAGYFAVWCDGLGRFRGEPYTAPQSRPVAWAFVDDVASVYLPEWQLDSDTFTVPNRYVCIGRTDGETVAQTAIATDENPNSPFSFQARGRWITRTDTDVEAASGAILHAVARRRLDEAQQEYATIEVTHPWLPFGLNDVVTFQNKALDEPVRAVVTKQTIKLDTGGLVTSTLRRLT